MKTLLLPLLCVFVWSQHTEGLTDQQVTLGHGVTVTCEFGLKAIVWFMIKPSGCRVMILRTFGHKEADQYNDKKFRNKYSEGSTSQLIINTVTADDLGIYYCIKPGETLEISDGIRLSTTGTHQGPNDPNPPQDPRAFQILIAMFTLLIVTLSAAVVGLLMKNRNLSKNIPTYVNVGCDQISERRITSFQTNGTVFPQNSRTGPEYQDVLPDSTYEIAIY